MERAAIFYRTWKNAMTVEQEWAGIAGSAERLAGVSPDIQPGRKCIDLMAGLCNQSEPGVS
jgi:hypothetical protein